MRFAGKMIIHECKQGTPEWHLWRAGKPTASVFSRLVTSMGVESKGIEKYARHLAIELFNGAANDNFGGNKHTERGHELEPFARIDYELENRVIVEQVGFCTDKLQRYGCSPDGLIGKDGGYEAKCKSDERHLDMLLQFEIDGQTPAEHVSQCQGSMFVTGRKWWDLHMYHPEMRSVTIRQTPDLLYFKTLRKQLAVIDARKKVILEFMRKQ